MTIRQEIYRQFRKPTGILGGLVGFVMSIRRSNRRRNAWLVELAEIRSDCDVLELGCGPGLALEACLKVVRGGSVTGLDQSDVMIRQAARRNHAALAEGRLKLSCVGIDGIPSLNAAFDRVISANVLHFLNDGELTQAVAGIIAAMKPGALMVTVFQPRTARATIADARDFANSLCEKLASAGIAEMAVHELQLKPVNAIGVVARTPLLS